MVPVTCETVDDIRWRIWDKLMVNCSINAITALTQATCGQVVDDSSASELLRDVVGEVAAVASAAMAASGSALSSSSSSSSSSNPSSSPSSGGGLSLDADAVLEKYRGQWLLKSSMQQDVEAGRPTE